MSSFGIYLAHPIDQAGGLMYRWVDLLGELQSDLAELGFVYNPHQAFLAIGEPNPALDRINQLALAQCDALVALLPSRVPSIGVPFEILEAANMGKPVLLFTDNTESWSLRRFDDLAEAGDFLLVNVSNNPTTEEMQAALSWLGKRLALEDPPDENELKVLRVDVRAQLPTVAYPGDAGFDLAVVDSVVLQPGERTSLRTGLAFQLPPWSWGYLTGRSSSWDRGLLVAHSVIDTGWRGELLVRVWNTSDKPVAVLAGERLAQLVVLHNATRQVFLREATHLQPHPRGLSGLGSSGR